MLAMAVFGLAVTGVLSFTPDSIEAHTSSRNENHWDTVKHSGSLYFATIVVRTSASSSERKVGEYMSIYAHSNSGLVPNGDCEHDYYQFCFNGFTDPKIKYKSGSTYTLSLFTVDNCWIGEDDYGKCYQSSVNVYRASWPIDAEGSIRLGLRDDNNGFYYFLSCWCTVKTFTLHDYSVY
ncbi:MAG: hypothetical protein OXN21_14520 [Chloroflexota bacterium]|nr:hypothetical protein [Chloroflexota bacterium]